MTTVIGPRGSERVSLAYRLTRDLRRVVFPTPGGPTIVTSRGGGSSGIRSTWGTWNRFSLIYKCQNELQRDMGRIHRGIWRQISQGVLDLRKRKLLGCGLATELAIVLRIYLVVQTSSMLLLRLHWSMGGVCLLLHFRLLLKSPTATTTTNGKFLEASK